MKTNCNEQPRNKTLKNTEKKVDDDFTFVFELILIRKKMKREKNMVQKLNKNNADFFFNSK